MGWSIGYDPKWQRDIGYGVPAYCDHPRCTVEIDRGLAYVCCGEEPYGGERGCGLYFCGTHLQERCSRCRHYRPSFTAKPDHPMWIRHKLTDDSWGPWRLEHPAQALELARAVDAVDPVLANSVDPSTRDEKNANLAAGKESE